MRARISEATIALILELGRARCHCCGAGASLRVIAAQAKVSHMTVGNLFREHGILPAKQTIHFKRVPAHRCKVCGSINKISPCVLCMARKHQQEAASA